MLRNSRRPIVRAARLMPRPTKRCGSGCAQRRGCSAPGGIATLIWRADGLADVLAALDKDFGAITVLPVHPKPGAAAIRVLVRATKGNRAPLALLPGFLLADADGKPTAAAEAVLRAAEALSLTGN